MKMGVRSGMHIHGDGGEFYIVILHFLIISDVLLQCLLDI